MESELGTYKDFLKDIQPFFHGKRLTYVDVGAFDGRTFEDVVASGLSLHEALLIEPNPASFSLLQHMLNEHPLGDRAGTLNVAVGASKGSASLQASRDMTRVVSFRDDGDLDRSTEEQEVEHGIGSDDGVFSVSCHTLDELCERLAEKHVSLLKIDVEGYEKEALLGAAGLLEREDVDVIYVEAGMNPEGRQQCYYRHLDDLLMKHGYRIFRVYEQVSEWLSDSPFLRRVNLAYMSPSFAARNPLRLSQELFELRQDVKTKRKALDTSSEALKKAEEELTHAKEVIERKDSLLKEREQRARTLEEELEDLRGRQLDLEERNRKWRVERARLKEEKRWLQEEYEQKARAFQALRRSWAYELGRALADGVISPRRMLTLPVRVGKIAGAYCFSKARQVASSEERPSARDAERASIALPKKQSGLFRKKEHLLVPEPRCVLWEAGRISEELGYETAMAVLGRYGSEPERFAGSLLSANEHAQSDEKWLQYVNAYVSRFGVSRIELESGNEPRFSRLKSTSLRRVASGPLVTVIMPARDAEATIEQAARSILNQTWSPIELIMIDDASSDGTLRVMERLASEDARVILLKNPVNVGPYVSRNRGLRLARGGFVTCHDSDDWAHPERIERHVGELLRQPKIKASIGYMIRIDINGRFTRFAKLGKTSPDGAKRLASVSCMFRIETLRRLFGYWDTVRFGADSELIERCRTVLKDGFATFDILTMICLDAPGSLTNDTVHGVSRTSGISASRAFYRAEWERWHSKIDEESCYLEFPQEPRKFDAPAAAKVPSRDIETVLEVTEGLERSSGASSGG